MKIYETQALFDALKCMGVVHTWNELLSCIVTPPLSENNVDKEFTLTAKVLDCQSLKMRVLELTESWSHVSQSVPSLYNQF